jgi:hypothetical protein
MTQERTSDTDHEVLAQRISSMGGQINELESRVSDLVARTLDIEKVNVRLERAALTTARALSEISSHWDAVYEAMRRAEDSDAAGSTPL